MASLSTRNLIVCCLFRHHANQRAVFHHQSIAPNRNNTPKTSFTCCSRRTFIASRSFWSPKIQLFGKVNNRRPYFSVVSAVLGTVGFFAGFVYYLKYRSSTIPGALPATNTVCAATDDSPHRGISLRKQFNFVADVVEKAAPSVVYIELNDRQGFTGRIMPVSNGSGFIVRSDGLVVTNAHVVGNKSTVKVRLLDGKELSGWVIAVDPVSDLAAIKIDGTGLPVLKMGLSCKLRAGEWVIAMGSPLSLSNTVTCGIVSSVNRGSKELGIRNKDMEYIQTDALINFGNSGGPLINLDGEVIGINAMKVTPGISFAIPSDYASNFLTKVDEVLRRGQPKKRQWFSLGADTTRRRFIGITMLSLNSQLLLELKSRVPDFPDISGGVLVHKIVIGSPAFNGGLQAGDIITEINNQSIQASADVYRIVEASETLQIVAYRGQKKMNFTVHFRRNQIELCQMFSVC
ncbi:serine protease HTRA2, mitochondrial-like [Babylonia areolata]|uniref:serine protease HTRA2, mitochondrial-like n=1 Tax=Babylonia areolata TaxID=304850 RepID=UPI003FD0D6A7